MLSFRLSVFNRTKCFCLALYLRFTCLRSLLLPEVRVENWFFHLFLFLSQRSFSFFGKDISLIAYIFVFLISKYITTFRLILFYHLLVFAKWSSPGAPCFVSLLGVNKIDTRAYLICLHNYVMLLLYCYLKRKYKLSLYYSYYLLLIKLYLYINTRYYSVLY